MTKNLTTPKGIGNLPGFLSEKETQGAMEYAMRLIERRYAQITAATERPKKDTGEKPKNGK